MLDDRENLIAKTLSHVIACVTAVKHLEAEGSNTMVKEGLRSWDNVVHDRFTIGVYRRS